MLLKEYLAVTNDRVNMHSTLASRSMLCPYTPGSYLQHRFAQYYYLRNCHYQNPRLLGLINFSRHDKLYFFTSPLVSNYSSFCALAKEPPIVQLGHPALGAADLVSDHHTLVTMFDAFAAHTLQLISFLRVSHVFNGTNPSPHTPSP